MKSVVSNWKKDYLTEEDLTYFDELDKLELSPADSWKYKYFRLLRNIRRLFRKLDEVDMKRRQAADGARASMRLANQTSIASTSNSLHVSSSEQSARCSLNGLSVERYFERSGSSLSKQSTLQTGLTPEFATVHNKEGVRIGSALKVGNGKFFKATNMEAVQGTLNSQYTKWTHFPLEVYRKCYLRPMDTEDIFVTFQEMDDRFASVDTAAGTLYTYLFVREVYVPYYKHPQEEKWIKLPVILEANIPRVRSMTMQVKKEVGWVDTLEIVATLRACNYDVSETIETFRKTLAIGALNLQAFSRRAKNVSWSEVLQTMQGMEREIDQLQRELNIQSRTDAVKSEKLAQLESERKALEDERVELLAKLKSLEGQLKAERKKKEKAFAMSAVVTAGNK